MLLRGVVLVAMSALLGCTNTPFTACEFEPDVSGHWSLVLIPVAGGGVPHADTLDAQLMQVKRSSGLGALVWGTIVSADKSYFDTLTIPQLMHNNGSKTGGVLGCQVKINVPIAANPSDDDVDNGPLRLSLSGNITARGMIVGEASTIIRQDDTSMMQGTFTWSGTRQ